MATTARPWLVPAVAFFFFIGFCIFYQHASGFFRGMFFFRPLRILILLPFFQRFYNGVGELIGNDGDGLCRIIIGRNSKINQGGIRVGIYNANGLDTQPPCFSQRNVFMHDIHEENRGR